MMAELNEKLNKICLQGRVKFPIGGKVRERVSAGVSIFGWLSQD
jgi:hypothetical protein